jgi:hypothetical protein
MREKFLTIALDKLALIRQRECFEGQRQWLQATLQSFPGVHSGTGQENHLGRRGCRRTAMKTTRWPLGLGTVPYTSTAVEAQSFELDGTYTECPGGQEIAPILLQVTEKTI